jgi:hypothetical protein
VSLYAPQMPRSFRTFVLLMAFVAMLGVATVSASPAHFHADSSANGCNICFAAHTVAFETPSIQAVFCPEIGDKAALPMPVSGYHARAAQVSFSRGPPTPSL